MGLHALLVVEQRYQEAQHLLHVERRLPRKRVWPLQIAGVVAGAPQMREAGLAADSLSRLADSEGGSAVYLMSVGLWHHHARHADSVGALADRATAAARRAGATRLDSLAEQALLSWAALENGDTLRALRSFEALAPRRWP